ncbi:MAG: TIGR02221 family CRISPR-associated protein [Alistipes sp.]|nr:TIGR02221 family CRISPR-associated protein [Alistipes sp.]
MAKVLISFLGTGIFKDASKRTYCTAKYSFNSTTLESSFVSKVLYDSLGIDKMILIGSTHSMWEEVYRVFADEGQRAPFDEAKWVDIYTACDANTNASELAIPHPEAIEEAIGGGSHVVLVKYGIDADEIKQNSEIILGLESLLNENDELYVDITHSFRSLPLYVMNLLVYLRNVSPKNITIAGIYYGMLEARREFNNIAPIVELSDILNVNDWISGAYSFMQFGNAYKIASLIPAQYKSVSDTLREFSDIENLNHLVALYDQYKKLKTLANENQNWPRIMQMIIPQVVGRYTKTIEPKTSANHKTSDFQFNIAKWQLGRYNFLAAITALVEAIVTRCCELVAMDYTDNLESLAKNKLFRDATKDYLTGVCYNKIGTIDILRDWAVLWQSIALIRNRLVHALEIEDAPEQIIEKLRNAIKKYNKLIMKDGKLEYNYAEAYIWINNRYEELQNNRQ